MTQRTSLHARFVVIGIAIATLVCCSTEHAGAETLMRNFDPTDILSMAKAPPKLPPIVVYDLTHQKPASKIPLRIPMPPQHDEIKRAPPPPALNPKVIFADFKTRSSQGLLDCHARMHSNTVGYNWYEDPNGVEQRGMPGRWTLKPVNVEGTTSDYDWYVNSIERDRNGQVWVWLARAYAYHLQDLTLHGRDCSAIPIEDQ